MTTVLGVVPGTTSVRSTAGWASATGPVPGGGETDVTVTLDPPMPDDQFVAAASVVQDTAGSGLTVLRIRTITADTVVVNVQNTSLMPASGTVHVVTTPTV